MNKPNVARLWRHLGSSEHCLIPPHEVVLAALVLVPHRDFELLGLVLEEVEVELLLPTRVQGLVDRLRLVALVAKSEKEKGQPCLFLCDHALDA